MCEVAGRAGSAGATGGWHIDKRRSPRRRDRQAGRFAISSPRRSSLVDMPAANHSCGAQVRTKPGRTVPNFPLGVRSIFPSPGRARTTAECRPGKTEWKAGGLTSANAESRAKARNTKPRGYVSSPLISFRPGTKILICALICEICEICVQALACAAETARAPGYLAAENPSSPDQPRLGLTHMRPSSQTLSEPARPKLRQIGRLP
jgi:hypothetical protein